MRSIWVFQVGSIGDVAVRLHVTLLLIFACLTLGTPFSNAGQDGWLAIAFVASLLVHEAAHAVTAKCCRVGVNAVTLFPFGGVASMSKTPSAWSQIVIAAAGPLASLAMVLVGWTASGTNLLHPLGLLFKGEFQNIAPLEKCVAVSLLLTAINLIPVIPFDGGRALKAALTLAKVAAPSIVLARVSQISCLGVAVLAFLISQPVLLIAAFVIFFSALREHMRAEGATAARAFTVRDAMIPFSRLETFSHGTTVSTALKTALTSLQPFFPIMLNAKLVGFVFRDLILEHSALSPDDYLATIAEPPIEEVTSTTPLSDALTTFEVTGASMLVVRDGEELLGVLIPDRVAEFVIMKTLPRKPSDGDDVPWSIQM